MFLAHERKLIELAERMGLPLAYLTSMDIAADPHLLDGASALFSPGPRRVLVAAGAGARHRGPRRGRRTSRSSGANAMFRRTRLARTQLGPRRLVICYKTSYLQDPMYGKDNALVTSDWREPPDPDPESSLTGTLYESNPGRRRLRGGRAGRLDVAPAPGWRKGTGSARPGRHRVRPGQPGLAGASGRSRSCPTRR